MSQHVTADDRRFMEVALALGRRGLGQTWPNPAVGALVVRYEADGPVIVGRGWTQLGGRPHAETEALRRAGGAARGATLYTTLEPCSHHGRTAPCTDAIIAAGISRVVSALADPNPEVAGAGHARLQAAGVAVTVGIGADEARRDHAGHVRRMGDGRPHVLLKLAVSADDKVGLEGRRTAAITGEEVRAQVHLLRASSDAILTGIGTVIADDPLLTCRLPGMAERSPIRIVFDTQLRLPLASRIVQSARETPLWVVCAQDAPTAKGEALRALGVDVVQTSISNRQLDLSNTLRLLAERGITRVLVEGGPILAAAFIKADLVDEALLFRSKMTIGPEGVDALEGLLLTALTRSPQLVSRGTENVGADTVNRFERRA